MHESMSIEELYEKMVELARKAELSVNSDKA